MCPIGLQEIPDEIVEYLSVVNGINYPRQGHTSDVGILESARGSYILKRSKGEQFCAWLAQEARVLTILSHTALPIPRLFKFVEQQAEKQAWALLQYFEGETLRQALTKEKVLANKHDLIFQFGTILAKLHSSVCPEELKGEMDWLDNMLLRAEYNLNHYPVDGTAESLRRLKDNRPAPIPNTFIHGDFNIDNVIVNNGKIVSIIDWSGGAFGDPRYDVSLAIRPKPGAIESEAEINSFFEGYGTRIIGEHEYNYFEAGLYDFF
jgi:aminoglycoside phosphotransferase (APT) family kinase protein